MSLNGRTPEGNVEKSVLMDRSAEVASVSVESKPNHLKLSKASKEYKLRGTIPPKMLSMSADRQHDAQVMPEDENGDSKLVRASEGVTERPSNAEPKPLSGSEREKLEALQRQDQRYRAFHNVSLAQRLRAVGKPRSHSEADKGRNEMASRSIRRQEIPRPPLQPGGGGDLAHREHNAKERSVGHQSTMSAESWTANRYPLKGLSRVG